MSIEYGLSLGSNLGDRLANLRAARDAVGAHEAASVVAVSPVYETEPVDPPEGYEHYAYLNAFLVVDSTLEPMDFLSVVLSIESRLGRVRTGLANEPRVIDIDIVYAGDRVIKKEHLVIPHPYLTDRRFVIQPLADIRPDLILPNQVCPVKDLLESLPEAPRVMLHSKSW